MYDNLSSPLLQILRGGHSLVDPVAPNSSTDAAAAAATTTVTNNKNYYNPLSLYAQCMAIVVVWISTGTIFYSVVNKWPVPQSFFYAVDAGMSIGFCTDVAETLLVSKAFTIIFILLGASVVGGALALFIQDSVEGIAYGSRAGGPNQKRTKYTKEYQLLLERDIFDKYDVSHTGTLSFDEFKSLLLANTVDDPPSLSSPKTKRPALSEKEVYFLWTKFDRLKDGVIHFDEEFAGRFDKVGDLLKTLQDDSINSSSPTTEASPSSRMFWGIFCKIESILQQFLDPLLTTWQSEDRIYFVFILWVVLGVTWGVIDQSWDVITATHFAVSALATGGLTAPPVNDEGILPAEPAIFCGVYCLIGIPLMACALGHFATTLVSKHVRRMDESALTQPITASDFDVALHLTRTKANSKKATDGLRFGDYVLLQLLRQGRLSYHNLETMRTEFETLDNNKNGVLHVEDVV
eukprot:CAMPEP_0113492388 /NCGR_PEP_ID=MMETSP0014_2-20120614/28048_1 /TAXON_ID=2857 /ORGANISM="Nitzschia sp." /LENGTH=462 /DNA_ID=CAMNT_0000386213 /DNA_START=47 /DNA_END=1435 /DNA_ORIENTATION=+ /assembly_acc=CAM_ASM_000159